MLSTLLFLFLLPLCFGHYNKWSSVSYWRMYPGHLFIPVTGLCVWFVGSNLHMIFDVWRNWASRILFLTLFNDVQYTKSNVPTCQSTLLLWYLSVVSLWLAWSICSFRFGVIHMPFTFNMALDPSYGGWRTSVALLRKLPPLVSFEMSDASLLHLILTFALTWSGFGALLVSSSLAQLLLVLAGLNIPFSSSFLVLLISPSSEHDDSASTSKHSMCQASAYAPGT